MNHDEYQALLRHEADEAWRRAAHLVALLAVDRDPDAFTAAMSRFAEESDTLFATAVVSACTRMVAELLEPHPIDARREVLMSVIANHSTFDTADLEPPEAPS
jgi:hypothetical protein